MKTTDLFRKKSIAQIQADAEAGFSDAETVPGDNATLRRSLGTFDLTMLGIAAIIGAGIFAMVGQAANRGGPGVVFLFIFAAIACGFSALVLCRIRFENPDCGLGIHVRLRQFRRAAGMDYRLGFAGRIRYRQYRRRHLVERLFYEPAQGKRDSTFRRITRWII